MKKLIGKVIKAKTAKTVTVLVERFWKHPIYQKRIKRSKKYLVNDQIGVKVNDRVIIQETRPISKKKCWKIVEKIKN